MESETKTTPSEPEMLVATATPPAEWEGAEEGLTVHVVSTADGCTIAALRAAARFAKFVGGAVCLQVLFEVPFALPLDKPQIPLTLLNSRYCQLVLQAGIDARLHICLCRNKRDALRRLLKPPSVVVIGGRKRNWLNKERRLASLLQELGHEVLFVSDNGEEVTP